MYPWIAGLRLASIRDRVADTQMTKFWRVVQAWQSSSCQPMKPVPEEFRILQLIRELGMPTSEKIFNRDAWLAGLLRGRRTVASSSANYKWHPSHAVFESGCGSRSVRGQLFTSVMFLSPKASLRLAKARSTS